MGKYDSIIKYYDAIKSGDFGEIIVYQGYLVIKVN